MSAAGARELSCQGLWRIAFDSRTRRTRDGRFLSQERGGGALGVRRRPDSTNE